MNPDELKTIWAQQTTAVSGSAAVNPEFIWRLAAESTRFKRTVFWRDAREWVATILVAGALLYTAFRPARVHWPIVAAAIIACIPMTYVALRGKEPPVPKTAQLTDHLRDAVAQVQHQIELLRSVARWYLAPLAVSSAIFLLDGLLTAPIPTGERKLMIVPFFMGIIVIGAVFYAVWKLNQFAVRKRLEPRLRRLLETLAEIER